MTKEVHEELEKMNTQMTRTQKLYEDAAFLHLIHNGRKIRRDHFDRYWEDLDLIE